MKKPNFDFPVRTEQIKAGKVIIPERIAVVREDTNQPLAVVSEHYGLVKHEDVINSLRKILKGQKFEEKIELQKNGARLFATYTLPDLKMTVAKGDTIALRLIAKNSYDSSSSFQLLLGAFRLVCSNGMIIGEKLFSLNQRHFNNVIKIDNDKLQENIKSLIKSFNESLPVIQKMINTEIKQDVSKILDKESKSQNISNYLCKSAGEQLEGKEKITVWDFYNALTHSITHKMRNDKPFSRFYYLQEAWKSAEALIV